MLLERGALLNNRYRIVEILGQGGMGSVYRAVDENLGVEVAVKDNLFTTTEFARQFHREAIILANLRQTNLPRVTDHFVIEGQGQYLVMDYIDGEDLRQRMDRLGPITEDEAVIIGAAICDALTYLSTRNPPVVHRDIKPGNVKITPQGHIYLVDFGLAKVQMGAQATTTGARAMTPGYSPPEQYGTARTDNRSDIFSLGATLYAALSSAIPEDALARAMEQEKLTPLREQAPKVSRRLATVIEKSLEVRPENRYQTAEEFKQALLSTRSATKRRTPELMVTPPPEGYDRAAPPNELVPPQPEPVKNGSISDSAPLSIFFSTPIEEEEGKSKSRPAGRRRKSVGCLTGLLILLVLLVSSGVIAYIYDPMLAERALAWAAVDIRRATPTATSPAGASAESPSVTESSGGPSPVNDVTDQPSPTVPAAIGGLPEPTRRPTKTPFPSPTPQGGGAGEIAFASDISGTVQIYISRPGGGDWTQVTSLPEGACQPSWSPDGRRLVFISPCETNLESYPGAGLFIIDRDGNNLVPLPSVPGGDYDPAWSPAGNKIAFTSIRNKGRPQIFLYDLETNDVVPLSGEDNRDMQPAWSPDGKQLVFVTTRKGPSQLWMMNADGTNQRLFSVSRDRVNLNPDWSANGQAILFTQVESQGAIPHLYAATINDVNDYREYPITSEVVPMKEGRYSPDGYWIIYESWPGGSNHDLFMMTSNGANRQTAISSNSSFEFDPAWNPR